MTKTVAAEPELSPAELEAAYRQAAYEAAQGNTVAAIRLERLEAQIEANTRAERRQAAAHAEAERRQDADAQQAKLAALAEADRQRLAALEAKTRAYDIVQQVTEELVQAVKLALIEGTEARTAQLQMGYAGGRHPGDELTDYIAWRLGHYTPDTAGLKDMPPVLPHSRRPLVQPITPKE